MLRRSEIALLLALTAGATLLALVPGVNRPVARLANYDADGPDPIYDADVNGAAIRRAAELIPDRATYYIHTLPANPLLVGNLKAAGQLFFAPALPVRDPAAAGWVLSYTAETLLPRGVRARAVHRLADRVYLVEAAR